MPPKAEKAERRDTAPVQLSGSQAPGGGQSPGGEDRNGARVGEPG